MGTHPLWWQTLTNAVAMILQRRSDNNGLFKVPRRGAPITIAVALCAVLLSGCRSPLSALRPKAEDPSTAGHTFYQRMESLKRLESSVSRLAPAEQENTVRQLSLLVKEEANPLLRAQSVRILGQIPNATANETLNLAESDTSASVRSALCEVRGNQRTREGLDALARIIANDDDVDVRMSAARQLRNYRHSDAYKALGLGLADNDPALQRLSVESLQIASGKNLGNNVATWRAFVENKPLPQAEPESGWSLPSWASLGRKKY